MWRFAHAHSLDVHEQLGPILFLLYWSSNQALLDPDLNAATKAKRPGASHGYDISSNWPIQISIFEQRLSESYVLVSTWTICFTLPHEDYTSRVRRNRAVPARNDDVSPPTGWYHLLRAVMVEMILAYYFGHLVDSYWTKLSCRRCGRDERGILLCPADSWLKIYPWRSNRSVLSVGIVPLPGFRYHQ